MSLILSGTDGLSDVDGSAATPAIRGTDANTGIFFPAADTIAFSEGGTEAMRIDSAGNVGIGTTSPGYKLDVNGSSRIGNGVSPNVLIQNTSSTGFAQITFNGDTSQAAYMWQNGSAAGAYGGANSLNLYVTPAAPITFSTSAAERMRLDGSGNFYVNAGFGTAGIAYACRAWVNFNGTGTVAIRASGNVSSITDNGTGNYTINFTTAMPDVNYATVGTAWYPGAQQELLNGNSGGTYSTSAVQVYTVNSANGVTLDSPIVNVTVTR
jgi:hypothetical protein